MKLDLAIVGAGPAGLSAGLAAQENGLFARVFEASSKVGGQLLRADHPIGDVLGSPAPDGPALVAKLEAHARSRGVAIDLGVSIGSIAREGDLFRLDDRAEARAVLLATGTRARRLGIPGEEVDVEVRSLGPALKGRRVAIAGGGDEAVSTANALADHGVLVTIIARAELRARPQFEAPARASPLITILTGEQITAIEPGRVTLRSGRLVEAERTFVRIGVELALPRLTPEPVRAPHGGILVDAMMRTSVPGLFAAGDLVQPLGARYATMAIAQGVVAVRAAEEA